MSQPTDQRPDPLRIRQAGNWPEGDLLVDGLHSCCGNICDGISVRLAGDRGGWVMRREDVLELAKLLQDEPPSTELCVHHGRGSK